jgi:hypothetical protein
VSRGLNPASFQHPTPEDLPLRDRLQATLVAAFTLAAMLLVAAPAPTSAATLKVAIIVGPTGDLTDTYREDADDVAASAEAAGATVVKVYSPNATWVNVKNAVAGANVIVWMGHGNGYPSPYSATESTDRVNGWGLNRTTTNGDSDNWSTTMAYCGERALLGQLTSADDSTRLRYCGGTANDGIAPAPGFVMIYAHACYTAGAGEPGEVGPSQSQALSRVANFSDPMLRLGARAYFATMGGASNLVSQVLTNRDTSFADIFSSGWGYSGSALRAFDHPDRSGQRIWLQTNGYHYAFAGNPGLTPSGQQLLYGGYYQDVWDSPFRANVVWLADQDITRGCSETRFCPTSVVTRAQMASFLARALGLPTSSTDYFIDDDGNLHETNINRMAASEITHGCAAEEYCPSTRVTRAQMASFLARALSLPPAPADYFSDDADSRHQDNINRLAASGITGGCATGRFCPDAPVTREQMAAFLNRAFPNGALGS